MSRVFDINIMSKDRRGQARPINLSAFLSYIKQKQSCLKAASLNKSMRAFEQWWLQSW